MKLLALIFPMAYQYDGRKGTATPRDTHADPQLLLGSSPGSGYYYETGVSSCRE